MKEKDKEQMKPEERIKLGICAMEKKVKSKHMQNILKGLEAFDEFELIIFDEFTIFNKEVEDWPFVHSMIIFFSNRFPYSKGLKYLNLRKPFLINDFEIQKIFWDRRKIYRILEENNIPTPFHLYVDRGEEINNDNLKKDPNDDLEIEKMISQYSKNSKEIKDEKRKIPKRESLMQIISPNSNSMLLQLENKAINPSTTSLINLEDNYDYINKAVINKYRSQSLNNFSSTNNNFQKSFSDTIKEMKSEISELNPESVYGIDSETYNNTEINKDENASVSKTKAELYFSNSSNNYFQNDSAIKSNNINRASISNNKGETLINSNNINNKPQNFNISRGSRAKSEKFFHMLSSPNLPCYQAKIVETHSAQPNELEENTFYNNIKNKNFSHYEDHEKCENTNNNSKTNYFKIDNSDSNADKYNSNKIALNHDLNSNEQKVNENIDDDIDDVNNNNHNNNNIENNLKSDYFDNCLNCINLEKKANQSNNNKIEKDNEIDENYDSIENNRSISNNDSFNNITNYINQNNIENEIIENEDFIEHKGQKIFKPFVEKPPNGDDHNIYIYYPPSLGGGHKRLFRKTKKLSSIFIANEDNIRRDNSYIYEEFLQTDGFDIKVYTIGPEYAHAEARKSPTLDGVVNRSAEGKEIRYPINLTPYEKEIARKIVAIFKQNICGFDILRSKGKSYVCDVNGWSFVKGNRKYYEDCVVLIRKMILMNVDPKRFEKKPLSLQIHVPTYEELILPHRPKPQNLKHEEELRSVVSIFRHGDRSPKQKMKFVTTDKKILNLYEKYANKSLKEIKLKKPKQLMEVLNLTQELLLDYNITDEDSLIGINDTFVNKVIQLKMVLEKNVNFEGMTRKVQIKPLKFEELINEKGVKEYKVQEALFILKWGGDITHSGIEQARLLGNTFRVQIYPNYLGEGDGLLRLHSTYRHDLKCYSSEEGRCMKTAAAFLQGLLQLDGNLIPIVSSMVRRDDPVLDMLDVSSDEIIDLKKKVKDELSECLHHDGNLLQKFKNYFKNRPVVESKEDIEDHSLYRLMDKISNPYKVMGVIYNSMDKLIQYIKNLLTQEEIELDSGTYLINRPVILQRRKMSETPLITINNSTNDNKESKKFLPRSSCCYRKTARWETLFDKRPSKKKYNDEEDSIDKPDFDCEDEKVILIYKRWIKLYQDFYNTKKQLFDISKIPDIYDNIKYDLIHNKHLLNDDAYNLFYNINLLANFVMPLEYGITVDEKVKIGIKVIGRLLNKIHNDLLWWFHTNSSNNFYYYHYANNIKEFEYENESFSGLDRGKLNNDIKSAWRHVKTRFYFTSASHLYSLINTIIFGIDSFLIDTTETNQIFIKQLKNVLDLDYLSHIMFRLYENFNYNFEDPKRFRLEIIMSPGSNKSPPDSDEDHLIPISPWIILNKNLTLKEMEEFFSKLKQQHFE